MISQASHKHKNGRVCQWDSAHQEWYTQVGEDDVDPDQLRFIDTFMGCPNPKERGVKESGDRDKLLADLGPE